MIFCGDLPYNQMLLYLSDIALRCSSQMLVSTNFFFQANEIYVGAFVFASWLLQVLFLMSTDRMKIDVARPEENSIRGMLVNYRIYTHKATIYQIPIFCTQCANHFKRKSIGYFIYQILIRERCSFCICTESWKTAPNNDMIATARIVGVP